MKIAQISPLFERVPPVGYGGTERVVSYLTEELVRRGHDVTLFASGDSLTGAELVPGCARALRLDGKSQAHLPYHLTMLDEVFARVDEFDLVHFHIDCIHFPLTARHSVAALTTLHGRLDLDDIHECFQHFKNLSFVSISDDQRAPMPWLDWAGTVHHGLPLDLHTPVERPGDHLAFLGRMSPEKGAETAIEIARRAGMPIRLAGKVDDVDVSYFEQKIRPLFSAGDLEYVGEIGGNAKDEFLGGARALLFPIDWPEPFGLVMIEAMACGTPVVAFRRGSVPEVIDDGVTGFVVDSVDDAVAALAACASLDRRLIRETFERRFSATRMTDDYLQIYEHLLERGATHARATHRHGGTGRRAARASYRSSGTRVPR
jgi:glycosyltransferase involved in cell wall biosynthesis